MIETKTLHILKKYQDHIPCSFVYKIVCIYDKFSKPLVLYIGKNTVNKFIEAILEEYDHCKKVIKKHFTKNLFMSVEDERKFQSSNIMFTDEDKKLRDRDCKINLKLTKKFL